MPVVQKEVEARHGLFDRLAEARGQTDLLFDLVKPDFVYARPIPERHRIVFYVGHLEAFDWNLLGNRVFDLDAFHPQLDRLFAFGIDPVDGGLPSDQPTDWPSLLEVRAYVDRVRRTLDHRIHSAFAADSGRPASDSFLCLLLHVAIEHRLMHAETLAYMLHQLPHDQKIPQIYAPDSHSSFSAAMLDIPAGAATLGLARDRPNRFGWDNEYEAHAVNVPPFAIDRYMITNGQYLDFIAANGYERRELWSNAGWNWKTAQNIEHPVFWKRRGDGWHCRTMFDNVPLPLDWPVYVSHAEASAYARWAGKSLPTEAQWHRAAYGAAAEGERDYPWGGEPPRPEHGNFDFKRWDPAPVAAFPAGDSAFGVSGMLGNGWEWTATEFAPFAGFEPFAFYPGYSADFFDGKHFVLKGGSPRTAACMLRRSFRNWFQPHYQYVYAGFRCVSS